MILSGVWFVCFGRFQRFDSSSLHVLRMRFHKNLLELRLKYGLYGIKCETDLKLGLYNVYYLSSIVCVCTSLLY